MMVRQNFRFVSQKDVLPFRTSQVKVDNNLRETPVKNVVNRDHA
jgi:hypothetical protein